MEMSKTIIYKVASAVKTALLLLIGVILMIVLFGAAVLQQSYRMTPPSDAELTEEPSLVIYRGE